MKITIHEIDSDTAKEITACFEQFFLDLKKLVSKSPINGMHANHQMLGLVHALVSHAYVSFFADYRGTETEFLAKQLQSLESTYYELQRRIKHNDNQSNNTHA